MRAICVRRGRPAFRAALLAAYGGRCAITDCDVEDVLEAAHISPYSGPVVPPCLEWTAAARGHPHAVRLWVVDLRSQDAKASACRQAKDIGLRWKIFVRYRKLNFR
jgi:hypothetical protein